MSNLKALLQVLVSIVVLVAAVRLLAGRWDLPMVWMSFGVYFGSLLLAWLTVFSKDPALLKERREPGPGVKRWDQLLLQIYGTVLLLTVIVALLDVGRFQWSDGVPLWLQIAGLFGFMVSLAFSGWALTENRFYSELVRIQRDRGHQVVTTGPYRYVRHPGYLGNMITFPCFALALGSWLALILSAVPIALFVVRTAMEDRMLREELEGYAEYAQQVRYRLVPGMW